MPGQIFSLSSWWLLLVLLALAYLAIEVGRQLGLRVGRRYDETARAQMSTLQSGILGTVGLLLGFAFSVALARFDDRRKLVIEEANAIGTAYLRCQILASPERERAETLLVRYTDIRLSAFERRGQSATALAPLVRESERLQVELWQIAMNAASKDARPIMSLFVSALNTVIDLQTSRLALRSSHVPVMVSWVVLAFVILGLGTLGFAIATSYNRRLGMEYAFATLLAVLLVLIIDLDRPGRGVIPIDHDAMYYQRSSMQ